MIPNSTHKSNVLIVDDHPMTVDSYISVLSAIENSENIQYHIAYSCRDAYNTVTNLRGRNIVPDIAFLDVSIPPYKEKKMETGIDVAALIRVNFPSCKIVMITMHSEPVWVNRIFKSINPEGFISKSEINYKTFPEAYDKLLHGEYYYSPSILESQRFFIRKNIDWDEHDSKILILISEGKKTVNLPDYIALSLSTIEKRKANLKKQLVFDGGSDQDLIEVAKKLGLF